ncbi:MAG: PEP-CTERM sorting domain-containing protein [Kiritimatiellae bacterium]|nr:PEP-CTERM sorting domain-containing protein [Kiritimatiellia bacterium]
MKKLLIALAAVATAALVQAASVSWTISNVYSPSDSTAKVATGSMSAWLFVTANSTDVTTGIPVTTLAAVQAVLDSGDLTGLSSLAAAHGTNSSAGMFTGATGLEGFSSGSLTAIAVVVDSTDLATANNYFLAGNGTEKTATFTSATGIKTLGWGSQATITQSASGWTAVPEPTSGLLMLLGLAGLALRRKHA